MKARCFLFLTLSLLFLPTGGLFAQSAPEEVSLTVYSSADPASFDPQRFIAQQVNQYQARMNIYGVPGFGVIKEIRNVDLKSGRNEIRLTDVARYIDPTTVSFRDLTSGGNTTVLEQNFEFDLTSPQKLLEKFLDREISVEVTKGDDTSTIRGTLLSAAGNQLVLKTASGIELLQRHSPQVSLGELPEGLITKPTLVWKVQSRKNGKRRIRSTYQTDGITWRSDYNLLLNKTDDRADLGAWVTLMNLSGSGYKNATLKLVAGDVQRIKPQAMRGVAYAKKSMDLAGRGDAGFQEKSFFEYHLYTLPRKTDVLANSTQQITLFPTAQDVEVEKTLVYYGLSSAHSWGFSPSPMTDRNLGAQSNTKVDVYLQFQNEKENNLGMPLPAGKVRVYKTDEADGTLEFIGEDVIDHTPRDEKVLVKIGQAFDVVGERKQTDFRAEYNKKFMTETIEVTVKNHKDKDQKVVVRENLFRWVNWEITRKNVDFEKVDSRTIHFPVNVPAHGERKVTYTVKYSW